MRITMNPASSILTGKENTTALGKRPAMQMVIDVATITMFQTKKASTVGKASRAN